LRQSAGTRILASLTGNARKLAGKKETSAGPNDGGFSTIPGLNSQALFMFFGPISPD
jgi:hypothetical protein